MTSLANLLTWSPDIDALKMVDEAYLDKEEWIKKSIYTACRVSGLNVLLVYLVLMIA